MQNHTKKTFLSGIRGWSRVILVFQIFQIWSPKNQIVFRCVEKNKRTVQPLTCTRSIIRCRTLQEGCAALLSGHSVEWFCPPLHSLYRRNRALVMVHRCWLPCSKVSINSFSPWLCWEGFLRVTLWSGCCLEARGSQRCPPAHLEARRRRVFGMRPSEWKHETWVSFFNNQVGSEWNILSETFFAW